MVSVVVTVVVAVVESGVVTVLTVLTFSRVSFDTFLDFPTKTRVFLTLF